MPWSLPGLANYSIFAAMANKLKKTAAKKGKGDPKKTDSKAFKPEKEENINWKGNTAPLHQLAGKSFINDRHR